MMISNDNEELIEVEEDTGTFINEYDILYGCNGCGCKIETIKNEERYTCNECPDFDLCGNCYKNEMILINGSKEEIEKLLKVEEYTPVKHDDLNTKLPHLITREPLSQLQLAKYLYGKSTFQTMSRVFKYYSNRLCLGYRERDKSTNQLSREFKYLTYLEVYKLTITMAKAITQFIDRRDFISIYMDNCLEWYISDFASLWCSLVVVPLHHASNYSNLYEILSNSESKCIVLNNSSFKNLIEIYEKEKTKIESAIKIKLIIHKEDEYDQILVNKLPDGVVFKTYNEMIKIGEGLKEGRYKFRPIEGNELSSVEYTSGSTGTPKGVMEDDSTSNKLLYCYSPFPNTILSYNPLSHSQRLSDWRYLYTGSKIAIYSGSMDTLFDDLSIVRPHSFWGVPRFFNLLYTQFKSNFKNQYQNNPELRYKCLNEIKLLLGDRIKSIYTGSAPTSLEVIEFVKECWNDIKFLISYGLTEVSGVAIDGVLCDGIEFKIESVESLNYSPEDLPNPRGELYVKSNRMAIGYYKNNKLTSESFINGWFKTGDIVEQIGERTIKIIDRIKNAFKLSNGEFVTPEPLENNFNSSLLIDQIFIYGNSFKTFLVAIVTPSQYCLNQIIVNSSDDFEIILKSKLLQEINLISNEKNLANYEIPKLISIDYTKWSVDNGLITGSGKISRNQLYKYYEDKINIMYNQIDKIQENLRRSVNNSDQFENYIKSILNISDNDYHNFNLDNLSFIQIGGDSLGAIKLSTYLKENQNIDISPSILLNQNLNLSNLSNLIKDPNDINLDNLKINWNNEMVLDQDIVNSISLNPSHDNNDGGKDSIFLTGSTGYLGCFLLYYLLECENVDKIYCLLRKVDNENQGLELIENVFKKAGLKINGSKIRDKVIPICGDLSKPLFGISNETYKYLSNSINLVIHNGAMVNMAYPYINMKSINVNSTKDILRLCCSNGVFKRLVYVSTIGVFFGNDKNNSIDESTIPSVSKLNYSNGYDQSKLVSDILVREAASLGLPTMIFRPGTIFSHTETGFNNCNDFIGLIIKGILGSMSYPSKSDYNGDGNLNLSPIDWVSSSMVSLINHLPYWETCNDNGGKEAQIFHMVNQNLISLEQIVEYINEVPEINNQIKPISYSIWKDIQFDSSNNPLNSASSLFENNFPIGDDHNFINPKTVKYLELIGKQQCEPISNMVISKYVKYLIDNNLIDQIKKPN